MYIGVNEKVINYNLGEFKEILAQASCFFIL